MKKINIALFLCVGFFLLFWQPVLAQRYKKTPQNESSGNDEADVANDSSKWRAFAKRLTFGGNFGASFGRASFVDISPMVGYRITDKWQAGIGATYNYLGWRYESNGVVYRERYSLYGGRGFSQFNILPQFFAHAEYEILNVPDFRAPFNPNARATVYTPLVGGGFRSQVGSRSFVNITALYNLNFEQNRQIFPYRYFSPLVLRFGFSL